MQKLLTFFYNKIPFTDEDIYCHILLIVSPLPNDKILDDKILDESNLKTFAGNKINASQKKIENIVGKRENAGYQHFLLFPQCFQNSFFSSVVKSRDCVVKGKEKSR